MALHPSIAKMASEAIGETPEDRIELGPKVSAKTAETIRIACVKRRCTQGELLDWMVARLAELAPGELEAGA